MQFNSYFWLNFLLIIPVLILAKWIISREISLKYIYLCLSLGSIIFAIAEPYYEAKISVRKFLFIIDVSRSMTVTDMKDSNGKAVSRLEFAKDMLAKAAPLLPKGVSVGVASTITGSFAFDENANIKIFWPVTALNEKNAGAFYKALKIIDWWNAWGDESQWPPFFASLAWVLDNLLDKDMNVVVITDGGSEWGNPANAVMIINTAKFTIDKARGKLTFFGVGEGMLKAVPDFGDDLKPTGQCFKQKEGTCFMSRIDENNLRKVAELSGGKYFRLRSPADLVSTVSSQNARAAGFETVNQSADKKFLLAALLFVVLFLVL